MKRLQNYLALLLLLSICAGFVPATHAAPAAQSEAHTATVQDDKTFKFTKVDLDLLAQVNLLDKRFEAEGLVYHNEAFDPYLQHLGESLLPDVRLENVEWNFRVMRDPVPNAFALPNGSVYVNSGLLALLDNEAQLASVLAHEITHVAHRHTYLQNRSIRKKVLAINIIETVAAWNPVGGVAGLAVNLLGTISPFLLEMSIFGYSRDLERDADLTGAQLMTIAGYDPREMVSTFKLLQKDVEGEQIKLFYNDHPQLDERIAYVNGLINNQSLKVSSTPHDVSPTAYLSTIEKAARHDVQIAINSARYRSAVYVSRKLVALDPSTPENFFYLGESYRTLGPRAAELTDKELTTGAKKDAAKKREKYTPEEEEARLLATPAGQENWKANQQQAEAAYQQALKLDVMNSSAHRGLGMLYEKLGRKSDAAVEYQKYLDLAPDATDRERIKRHLELVKGA